MSLLAAQNSIKKSYEFISNRVVYHALIWFCYMLALLFLDSGEESFLTILRNTVIHVFFLMLIVYTNYLYLIPNYLSKKRFISYLLLLLFTAAVVMPIEMVFLYWNIAEKENIEAQLELLKKQYGHFIFLF